jgi:hypothetical protein
VSTTAERTTPTRRSSACDRSGAWQSAVRGDGPRPALERTSLVATGGFARLLRPLLPLALVALAAALLPPSAAADIGVYTVRPAVAEPRETVRLRIACGGCPRGGLRLPVSLVPVESAPRPRPCRENALCRPTARRPPRDPPFRFLGRTGKDSRLRFAAPDLGPGRYAFVIYCEPCSRGSTASLIADADDPRALLRIEGTAEPFGAASAGTDVIWWLLAGAGVLFVAVAALVISRGSGRI